MQQRTLLLCIFINVLLSTSISASAFGRFRVKSPSGRSHYEEDHDNDNDEDHHDDDEAYRGNNNNDSDLDKRIRGRQRQQQQQQHRQLQPESSSWLDGMEMEQDYHVPPSSDHDDHDDHHHALLDSQQTHPLLQIPCAIHLPEQTSSHTRSQPVRTFCDTGAQRTVMSWDCAQRTGLLQHLDRRYAGQAMGVGSCRVLGRIPAGIGRLTLNGLVSIPSPAITVLESTTGGSSSDSNSESNSHDATAGVELLLGLDFLRDYQAILNLRTEELELIVDDDDNDGGNREVRIPFIRPRGGRSPRGGARAEAATTLPTARRHSSSDSSESSRSTNHYNSRARVHPHDEWESEEEDDESEDTGDIDMSGV
jgi:hypothetical protein